MGLERYISFILIIVVSFAPCMGLERPLYFQLNYRFPFAPCMGLESNFLIGLKRALPRLEGLKTFPS